MNSRVEIIEELKLAEANYSKIATDIAEGYKRIKAGNDSLVGPVNQKLESLKEIENRMQVLEKELANL